MTYKEAFESIKYELFEEGHCTYIEEELKVAIEALEKQIPKKPKLNTVRSAVCPTICPNCNKFIDRHDQRHGKIDIPCCKWCGQKIDWSDEDEKNTV